MAKQIALDKHLHTGLPLKKNTENIFGNAFEALVGAIYLDAGYDAAAAFLKKVLVGNNGIYLRRLSEHESDFKSRLLEYARAHNLNIEFNQLAEQYDPRTDQHVFLFNLTLDGKEIAQAAGHSKARAQQAVSRKALRYFSA